MPAGEESRGGEVVALGKERKETSAISKLRSCGPTTRRSRLSLELVASCAVLTVKSIALT